MPQILVRDISAEVASGLKRRANRNRRSLQAEVHLILERAARADISETRERLENFRRTLKGRRFSDSTRLVRRGRAR